MRLYRSFVTQQAYPKPVVLEMGSKNPTIVTAKADLEKAVEGVVRAAYGYGGQKCSACSRVYVQQEVRDRFLSQLIERVRKVTVGDPTKREVFMGPLINERAVLKFEESVRESQADGGMVVYGGRVLTEGGQAKGYFVEPTIITGIPHGHRLFKEELFVPLLAVDSFGTLDEALRKCNDTEYGLTAGLFSEDLGEVKQFFERIEFGVAYANRRGGATTGAWPGAQTFVGWKSSGSTGRGVGGPHYLLNYLREQSQTTVLESGGA
jgi:1-pyrroline-5-carboxylate dehydrogenase